MYLSLNGRIIPNNSYVTISDIGTSNDSALLCHTNRPASGGNSGGNWYSPVGTRVLGVYERNGVKGLVRNRAPMMVRLFKKTINASPLEGIYQCVINDFEKVEHTLNVGIYDSQSENGKSA